MSWKINIVLTAALVACALALVNAQYQVRHLFIQLERAQVKARQLDIEWAQLQLDQSTLGKHERIEAIARRAPGRDQLSFAGRPHGQAVPGK